ncbi:hypothetical protein GUJ93_ZPchr0004g38599 [Zizania palustris]|uniref:Uncharacterized protein n=1 Tax=Zizania palustris TaxID=103762 RepID=A0A8J5SK38_ZIZPA|nr:hypothetical protein GUJ93_ZPchr0004g38599 [Zizania palustris]
MVEMEFALQGKTAFAFAGAALRVWRAGSYMHGPPLVSTWRLFSSLAGPTWIASAGQSVATGHGLCGCGRY